MAGASPLRLAGQLSYQLSPIILTNGIAQYVPGGMLPIIALTEALNFTEGLLSGANIDFNNAFANFVLMPGGTLIANRVGEYPFANQATAANAIISDPLNLSLRMICPARGAGGFLVKLATITALKLALDAHSSSGGTYTVATPAYFYTNLLLLDLTDVSTNPKQPQSEWIWRFRKPLLTLEDAQNSLNTMMSKISGGLVTDGSTSGPNVTTGSPVSLAAPGVIPAASGTSGAGVSGIGDTGSLGGVGGSGL